jgi:hypothetical protein
VGVGVDDVRGAVHGGDNDVSDMCRHGVGPLLGFRVGGQAVSTHKLGACGLRGPARTPPEGSLVGCLMSPPRSLGVQDQRVTYSDLARVARHRGVGVFTASQVRGIPPLSGSRVVAPVVSARHADRSLAYRSSTRGPLAGTRLLY